MNEQRQKQSLKNGYLFALAATAIWSGNFIVARGLSESIPPVSLAFLRWSVATVAILPLSLKSIIAEWKTLKQHLPFLTVVSLLGVTIFNTLIYIAGHSTTAFNLSLISITAPIFIIILSRIFFREKITVKKGIGVIVVAAGVVLLLTQGNLGSLLNISFSIGDFWVLVSTTIFSIYSILLLYKPEGLSIWAFQGSTFILGTLFLSPFYIWERGNHPPVILETSAIFAILYVGLFASLTAFVLWNKALSTIGASKAGLIYYTLPLFSGLLAYLILGESISQYHFYSAVLIVAGILISNAKSKETP